VLRREFSCWRIRPGSRAASESWESLVGDWTELSLPDVALPKPGIVNEKRGNKRNRDLQYPQRAEIPFSRWDWESVVWRPGGSGATCCVLPEERDGVYAGFPVAAYWSLLSTSCTALKRLPFVDRRSIDALSVRPVIGFRVHNGRIPFAVRFLIFASSSDASSSSPVNKNSIYSPLAVWQKLPGSAGRSNATQGGRPPDILGRANECRRR